MLEQWLSDPSKIGATALLVAAVTAFYKGWVLPRWAHDTIVVDLQRQLERERAEKAEFKQMVLRAVELSDRAIVTAQKIKEARTP